VTRAQSAALLVRLQELLAGPLPAAPHAFEDVVGVHAEAVAKAVGAQLAGGTTPWTFDPAALVRRDQQVVLLVRALGALERTGAV
jgi:hypothetical protein